MCSCMRVFTVLHLSAKQPEQPNRNETKLPEIQLKGVTYRPQVLFAAIILTYLPSQVVVAHMSCFYRRFARLKQSTRA